jgi:Flp pilus assembly protein TadD
MTLKDEGNALFKQKRFREAHQKYTWAIELDSNNAIIFANRAACSLSLKKCVLYHTLLAARTMLNDTSGIATLFRMQNR